MLQQIKQITTDQDIKEIEQKQVENTKLYQKVY